MAPLGLVVVMTVAGIVFIMVVGIIAMASIVIALTTMTAAATAIIVTAMIPAAAAETGHQTDQHAEIDFNQAIVKVIIPNDDRNDIDNGSGGAGRHRRRARPMCSTGEGRGWQNRASEP